MGSINNLFSQDSAFFRYTDKLGKLIMLNLLVVIFSLPVLTVGSALSALYTMTLKVYADEEGNITAEFLKAFRENFKRATCIWLCFLAVIALLILDYWLLRTGVLPGANVLQWPVYIIAAITFCSGMWSLILQSRYENKVIGTIRNAFVFIYVYFPATIMMLLAATIPLFLLIISLNLMPIVLLCGISGPALLQTVFFSRIFKQLETKYIENNETENDIPAGM